MQRYVSGRNNRFMDAIQKTSKIIPLWRDDPSAECAGRILGLGKTSTYELAHAGEIPGLVRLGRKWVVKRSKLERWLEGEED